MEEKKKCFYLNICPEFCLLFLLGLRNVWLFRFQALVVPLKLQQLHGKEKKTTMDNSEMSSGMSRSALCLDLLF